ncbi:mitochondrial import receptor subunit TOM20 homolog [Drosophila persimilis]|uniref:mitochondrial import receptor subunit TOM20 homolog n=1 Tax=Drosophila persimilis TaxID=7234 RepID=UPI000F07FFD9|nr:mitochondrial import receptor subunit TOM20 homolog [Drosophila persimilis]
MLSSGSVKLLALGTAGALFIGYCVYFDRKRTSAPDYKKRVHERREREANAAKEQLAGLGISRGRPGLAGAARGNADDDQLEMEMQMHFVSEVQRGERLIKEGHVDQGLTHLSNAIMLCAHPGSLLEMLEANLPEQLFRPLMMRLAEMNRRGSSSEASSETTSEQPSEDSARASSTSATTTSAATSGASQLAAAVAAAAAAASAPAPSAATATQQPQP